VLHAEALGVIPQGCEVAKIVEKQCLEPWHYGDQRSILGHGTSEIDAIRSRVPTTWDIQSLFCCMGLGLR
jgi:hypothetical protein